MIDAGSAHDAKATSRADNQGRKEIHPDAIPLPAADTHLVRNRISIDKLKITRLKHLVHIKCSDYGAT